MTETLELTTPVPLASRSIRLSVAMCTYNGERFLSEQLESFLEQQRPPDELVICDDGSIDRTVEILSNFARKAAFPVRVFLNPSNLGYGRNFQKAVALTDGDVIALADQDDRWHPQKLSRLVELFADPATGGVFSNGDLIDIASRPVPGDLWNSFQFDSRDQKRFRTGDAFQVLLRRNVVTGMAFAFRSRFRDMLAWLPEPWPHDAWLGLLLAATGELRACPEHLVAYRMHASQQIGVPQTIADKHTSARAEGLAAYRSRSRERNVRAYRTDLMALETLLASSAAPLVSRWQSAIQGKIDHSRRGITQLEGPAWQRWPDVIWHWRDYLRYAPTGGMALLRDLLV
jgi:glycosyltransferase involved in cell wall biosynthesis